MKRAVSPSSWVLLIACVVLVAGQGCKPNTRDNPLGCDLYDGDTSCPTGRHCDHEKFMCVLDDAGAAGQGGDGSGGTGVGPGGGGDAGNGTAGGGAGAAGGGTAGQGGTPADGGMDAPGAHCVSNDDCAGKTGTLACDLATNTCVECLDDSTCSGAKPACAGTSCVECTGSNASACTGTTAICEPSKHQCIACVVDGDCKTAEKSFCSQNSCVACADSNACKARDGGKPVCAASGACVECDTDKDCHGTAPFCGPQKTCQSCNDVGADACTTLNGGVTPVCAASGACVQCGKDADCSPTSTTPFCSEAGACVACSSAPAGRNCMTLTTTKPACSTTGACVECVANSDCPDGKPVCSSSNACGACTSDTDCMNRGPGVCMSQLDGRCASTRETIYVQNGSGCSDAGGAAGGTAMAPFCSMQPATAAVTTARDLVVVRGTVGGATGAFTGNVSIVGQSSGTIAGTVSPALHVSGGTTYARGLKLLTVDSIGLQADSGSTVKLDHMLVTGNAGQASDLKGGGILLDGAAFDIRNTTVTGNGPGASGSSTLGGILVTSTPAPAGPRALQLVTVQNNNGPGIACSAAISGTGVLATGNTSVDILPACGITSCTTASTSCGAQP